MTSSNESLQQRQCNTAIHPRSHSYRFNFWGAAQTNLLSLGYNVSEIASVLCISPYTVRRHLSYIYEKLGIRSQIQLVVLYFNGNGKAEKDTRYDTGKQCLLSKREAEVLVLYNQGLVSKQIGEALFISDSTAREYLRRIRKKLGVD